MLWQAVSWPLPLTELDLSGNRLTEAATAAISAMLSQPVMTLKSLSLSRSLSEPGSEGTGRLVSTLAEDSGRRLSTLELEGCALDDSTLAEPLRRLLLGTSCLSRLNLSRNRLGRQTCDVLVDCIGAATSLHELLASNNAFGLVGCTELIASSASSGLELLRLDGAATSLTHSVDHKGSGLRSARLWDEARPVPAPGAALPAGKPAASASASTRRAGTASQGKASKSASAAGSQRGGDAAITQASLELGLLGDSATQFLWELGDAASQLRAERMPQAKVTRVLVEWPENEREPFMDILAGDPSMLARLSPRAWRLLHGEETGTARLAIAEEDDGEWRPETSVFRDRQFVAPSRSMLDTPELLAMTLEADWTATHLHTLLLDRVSQEEVKAVLAEHYAFLVQMFHFYCSFDQTPFQMKHVVFTDWRKRCGLTSYTNTAVEALMDAAFKGSDFGPSEKSSERKTRADAAAGKAATEDLAGGEDGAAALMEGGSDEDDDADDAARPVLDVEADAASGGLMGAVALRRPGEDGDSASGGGSESIWGTVDKAATAVERLAMEQQQAEQAAMKSASNRADVNSRHALTRHEFMEALVRMSVAIEGVKVVGTSSATATATAVRSVILNRLLPAASRDMGLTRSEDLFANAFRTDFMYTEAVDKAMRRRFKLASELYEHYAGDILVKGAASVGTGFGLTAKGWQAMLSDARMMSSDRGIGRPEANAHFAASACLCHYEGFPSAEAARACDVRTKEERKRLTHSRTLTKTEFLELLCRLAASPSATVFLPRSEAAGLGKKPKAAKTKPMAAKKPGAVGSESGRGGDDAVKGSAPYTADELAHMPLETRVGFIVQYLYSRTLGLKALGTSAGKQRFVMYEPVEAKVAAQAIRIMHGVIRTQLGHRVDGFFELSKGRVYTKTFVGSAFCLLLSLKL
jgi:hypothetical protein